ALLWPHERMAVYLPDVQEDLRVDLQTLSGPCRVRWFDPRTGEELTETSEVTGGGVADLPIVPSDRSHDWLVLIEEL
ncbi:MAG: putative collagen-binding domain-containing protein, partial [Planctomycetota bacterium]